MAQDISTVLLVGGGDGVGELSCVINAIATGIGYELCLSGGELVVYEKKSL